MGNIIFCPSIVLLLVYSTPSWAEDAKPQRDDAEIAKLVAESTEAARKENWQRYAELIHPESLKDYKEMWLPALRAVAKEGPDRQAELLSVFDKAAGLESVIAMPAKVFFASSMKGIASQFRRGVGSPLDVHENIIGIVHEGDAKAYIVARTRRTIGGTEMTKVELLTVERSGMQWKLMLPDVVRTIAQTFGRAGQATQKSGPVRDRADPGPG